MDIHIHHRKSSSSDQSSSCSFNSQYMGRYKVLEFKDRVSKMKTALSNKRINEKRMLKEETNTPYGLLHQYKGKYIFKFDTQLDTVINFDFDFEKHNEAMHFVNKTPPINSYSALYKLIKPKVVTMSSENDQKEPYKYLLKRINKKQLNKGQLMNHSKPSTTLSFPSKEIIQNKSSRDSCRSQSSFTLRNNSIKSGKENEAKATNNHTPSSTLSTNIGRPISSFTRLPSPRNKPMIINQKYILKNKFDIVQQYKRIMHRMEKEKKRTCFSYDKIEDLMKTRTDMKIMELNHKVIAKEGKMPSIKEIAKSYDLDGKCFKGIDSITMNELSMKSTHCPTKREMRHTFMQKLKQEIEENEEEET